MYGSKMERLLYSILQEDSKTLRENRSHVSKYLESDALDYVKRLVRSPNGQKNHEDDLEALVKTRMESEESRLLERLEKVRFEVDVPETLPLLCGPGRIEKVCCWRFCVSQELILHCKYLFPLLYLVLRHQYRILRLARKEVLSDRELDAAATTLDKITDGAWQRILRIWGRCVFRKTQGYAYGYL